MSAPLDPFAARLSEYLDGDLDPAARRALEGHLEGCAECRGTLVDLRRVVTAARALPEQDPERDPWPALEAALRREAGPRRASRPGPLLLAFAAGVLACLALWLVAGRGRGEDEVELARGARYLLLLHEPPGFGAGRPAQEPAEIAERYARWARALGARCVGGEELEPSGLALGAGAEPEPLARGNEAPVGGFFLLEVADEAEALELAGTCPHLEQGGWIELRRVVRR